MFADSETRFLSPEPDIHHDWCNTNAFAALGDQLVRDLLDTSLRLDRTRSVFDSGDPTNAEIDEFRTAVVEIVDNLNTMIRDTGLAMLTLTSSVPIVELKRKRLR
jgi:hypothetical protein